MNWDYLQSVVVTLSILTVFLAAVILAGAWALARFSRRARAQKLQADLLKVGQGLLALSPDEARRLASDRLLMSPDFETVRADSPLEQSGLGPELQALLDRYAEIHYLPDNSFVARSALAPHAEAPDWVRIGRDGEQDWLLVRAGQDEIAVWDAEADEPDQRLAERYPTIHHWLISLMP
jgi:hypothetical protein